MKTDISDLYNEIECPHCAKSNLYLSNYCCNCGGALHKKNGKFVDPYNKCREDGTNRYEFPDPMELDGD